MSPNLGDPSDPLVSHSILCHDLAILVLPGGTSELEQKMRDGSRQLFQPKICLSLCKAAGSSKMFQGKTASNVAVLELTNRQWMLNLLTT